MVRGQEFTVDAATLSLKNLWWSVW